MSLVQDFSNYYINTWIALKEGDINLPFYVMNVEQREEFSRHDYSHEAEQALYFVGQRWYKNSDGRLVHDVINVDVFDQRLIHESPDVGYLNHGRNMVSWTHINPVRQRVKGLVGNKIRALTTARSVSGQMVYNLFNPEFEGLVTRFIFVNPQNGFMYYKGAKVGLVNLEGQTRGRYPCTLLDKFKHITSDLINYEVTLVETL